MLGGASRREGSSPKEDDFPPSLIRGFGRRAMPSLLAMDLGLRTGLALYVQDGRLMWYRSQHYGTRARVAVGRLWTARCEPRSLPAGTRRGRADRRHLGPGGPAAEYTGEADQRRGLACQVLPPERPGGPGPIQVECRCPGPPGDRVVRCGPAHVAAARRSRGDPDRALGRAGGRVARQDRSGTERFLRRIRRSLPGSNSNLPSRSLCIQASRFFPRNTGFR
jgi:hypothetical protein